MKTEFIAPKAARIAWYPNEKPSYFVPEKPLKSAQGSRDPRWTGPRGEEFRARWWPGEDISEE